ncbi:uncharacterized protein EDB91DRAFT_1256838 [Suillus paluster]|uniref:uncharacterized protein n=1 Tax=Suillus paluster TaxID=48578 RepID=UPI001B8780B0|nr:uncharacterized protein EDB91DRAFT_1256838 [Suillus paluster]KAG1720760.1 hypothetical protein EDB91DRAFT_1256838 [Suillus paluster]
MVRFTSQHLFPPSASSYPPYTLSLYVSNTPFRKAIHTHFHTTSTALHLKALDFVGEVITTGNGPSCCDISSACSTLSLCGHACDAHSPAGLQKHPTGFLHVPHPFQAFTHLHVSCEDTLGPILSPNHSSSITLTDLAILMLAPTCPYLNILDLGVHNTNCVRRCCEMRKVLLSNDTGLDPLGATPPNNDIDMDQVGLQPNTRLIKHDVGESPIAFAGPPYPSTVPDLMVSIPRFPHAMAPWLAGIARRGESGHSGTYEARWEIVSDSFVCDSERRIVTGGFYVLSGGCIIWVFRRSDCELVSRKERLDDGTFCVC